MRGSTSVSDAPAVVDAMGDRRVDEGSDVVIDLRDVFGDIDLGDSLTPVRGCSGVAHAEPRRCCAAPR